MHSGLAHNSFHAKRSCIRHGHLYLNIVAQRAKDGNILDAALRPDNFNTLVEYLLTFSGKRAMERPLTQCQRIRLTK